MQWRFVWTCLIKEQSECRAKRLWLTQDCGQGYLRIQTTRNMNLYSHEFWKYHVGTVAMDWTNATWPADGILPLTFSDYKPHLRSKILDENTLATANTEGWFCLTIQEITSLKPPNVRFINTYITKIIWPFLCIFYLIISALVHKLIESVHISYL